MAKLKRSMGLFTAVLYGVGIIVGAGIYALIGKICGLAGNAVWLSFALSSLLAMFTGLSYAELSSFFPSDAAEFEYTRAATHNRFIELLVTWFVIGSFVVSASAVAIGFGNYLSPLLFGSHWNAGVNLGPISLNWPSIIAILVIALFTIVNFIGIKASNEINVPATILEITGLLLLVLGVAWLVLTGRVHLANYAAMPNGLGGVFSGAVLAFFAYVGFGSIAKIGEEMKNPRKNLPRAIIISIIITTILYILVAIAAVTAVPWNVLLKTPDPASAVAGAIHPGFRLLLSIIALFSTGNTVLLILVSTSRMAYGVAKDGALPRALAKIHPKTDTPYISVFAIGIVAMFLAMLKNIQTIAEITNIWIFIVYIFVNLSVILLRYERRTRRKPKHVFTVPGRIGWFPVIPGLGLLASIIMLGYSFFMIKLSPSQPGVWMTLLLLALTITFYFISGKKRPR